MRINHWFVVATIAGIGLGIAVSENSPRFKHIKTYTWTYSTGTSAGYDKIFTVFHDEESGNEIICVDEPHGGPSCFLSGRNWK
jgi:hypothetical protein